MYATLLASLLALSVSSAGAQQPPVSSQSSEPPLDPNSPMADMPDIGVAWPEMGVGDDVSPTASLDDSGDPQGERRYTVRLDGLERLNALPIAERFNTLSVLKQGESKPANTAQIDRRVREDQALLDSILRTSGHYDANVETNVENSAQGALLVRFLIAPGPLYRFQQVNVAGLETTGETAAQYGAVFGVNEDDPVDADDVIGGKAALEKTLRETGYPFAKVSEPDVVVDHEKRSGTLAMAVETGGRRNFGDFRIKSPNPPFGPEHIAVIARFKPGEPYDQKWVDDLRRALIATGVVGAVDVAPVPGVTSDRADIEVGFEQAPLRTIAGEAGFGTGEGARVELSWTHRNLIKPEGAVTIRGVAGTREQVAGIVLRQSNFRVRDHVLNARLLASNINRNAFDARTIEIAANLERQSNIIWQKRWTWSVGGELLASDERDLTQGLLANRRTFLIGAVPLSVGYDRSNDLLDPTNGFRIAARFSPEISLRQGRTGYARAQIDGSAYVPVSDRVVMAGRVRLGTVFGISTFKLAPSRRFYAGGGGSVRGFGYQAIGPRDAFNDPIGGRSLAEFGIEARIRLGDFGIVPFIDGGNIFDSKLPRLNGFRYGAGIGARYHSSFGPIRIDVGTPINPRKGDTPVTLFVSLGQAF